MTSLRSYKARGRPRQNLGSAQQVVERVLAE